MAGAELKVGVTVLIQSRHIGVVKFIGTTSFDPSKREWIGVELERAIGKHNGTVKGIKYFQAKAKHGTFVARAQCEVYSADEAAARKIQSAARMKIAKNKVSREVSWRTYNQLDNDDESQHLERRNKLLAGGLPATGGDRTTAAGRGRLIAEVDAMEVEPGYDGPRLAFPLDRKQVQDLMMGFRAGKLLHYKYVMQLLHHFEQAISRRPTLIRTTVNDGERLAVVGDTHGQLQDLYSIFTINGTPDERNRYIFNGDFVDRGERGVEVALTLMAFHLLYPDGALMNRGNHEERSQNETAGFLGEVMEKYNGAAVGDPQRALRVYEMFHAAFDSLPLATLIEKNGRKVFVVHGGLFDRNQNVRLQHIESINRKREIPWGRRTFEDRVFEDLLWSDPRDDIRGTEPSTRGAGVFFGPDVTERFCGLNGISLVIRSHECVRDGYLYQHNDRCLTIFSASRYCGTGVNNGAYIVFDKDLTNVVQQFMAGPLHTTDPKSADEGSIDEPYHVQPTSKPSVDDQENQEEVVRQKIIERIVLNKGDLYWYFSNADHDHVGTVTRVEWAEAMRTVLQMPDMPWMRLSHDLADAEDGGDKINYSKFLNRYKIQMREEDFRWQEAVVERVSQRLFEMCGTAEAAYKMFDANKDGKIEFSEMVNTFERLDVGLSRDQLYELMRTMDKDNDGHIDVTEFVDRFQVVFTRVARRDGGVTATGALGRDGGEAEEEMAEVDDWTLQALRRVGAHLFAGGRNAAQVFKTMDKDDSGSLSVDEFKGALDAMNLEPSFSAAEVRKIMDAIDTNRSGQINYMEFINAFKVGDTGLQREGGKSGTASATDSSLMGGRNWQAGIIERLVKVLYEYRIELRSAFARFDLDGSGTISAEEFRLGLKALTGAVGSPITDMQADELMRALDSDGSGSLSYAEFVDGFKLVDTEGRKKKRRGSRGGSRSGGSPAAAAAAGAGGR